MSNVLSYVLGVLHDNDARVKVRSNENDNSSALLLVSFNPSSDCAMIPANTLGCYPFVHCGCDSCFTEPQFFVTKMLRTLVQLLNNPRSSLMAGYHNLPKAYRLARDAHHTADACGDMWPKTNGFERSGRAMSSRGTNPRAHVEMLKDVYPSLVKEVEGALNNVVNVMNTFFSPDRYATFNIIDPPSDEQIVASPTTGDVVAVVPETIFNGQFFAGPILRPDDLRNWVSHVDCETVLSHMLYVRHREVLQVGDEKYFLLTLPGHIKDLLPFDGLYFNYVDVDTNMFIANLMVHTFLVNTAGNRYEPYPYPVHKMREAVLAAL